MYHMRNLSRIFIIGLLVCMLAIEILTAGWAGAQLPQSSPSPEQRSQNEIPIESGESSFSSMPALPNAGNFNFRDLAREAGIDPARIIGEIGYDPSRSWNLGDRIEDVLLLGDLQDMGNFPNWSISESAALGNIPIDSIRLSDIAPLRWQTIEDLVKAIPSLENAPLQSVPVLQDLLREAGIELEASQPLGALIKNNQIADIVLGKNGLDLSRYQLSAIPGLESTPLRELSRWVESPLSGIPGLSTIPLESLFSGFLQGGLTAIMDLPWSNKEARRLNTITGSYREGFRVPCQKKQCAYIELAGPEPVHGKQWISGRSQKVRGGSGCLRGREPTGRHPYGPAFKVVLTQTVEPEGQADFAIYFPLSVPCGNSLYVLGPFPWRSYHEKDNIFVGLLDPAPPTEDRDPAPSPSLEAEDSSDPINPDPTAGQDQCETYKGVNIASLKTAIATIESQGAGYYRTVGAYVCDQQGNCGRGLGKYQFMSYRSDVAGVISTKPGGAEFLVKARSSSTTRAEIESELSEYFTPFEQEALADTWLKRLVDNAASRGLQGDDLVRNAGEQHNAGEEGSSPEYGKRTADIYNRVKPGITANCESSKGLCTGGFANPAPGFPKTDGFGSCRPLGRCSRRHQGVDIGTPTGTPIRAADGGTVTFTGTKGCYGITIDVQHCKAGRITRYGHLSEILVSPGELVTKGQVIGKSGATGCGSGPHLHFETHPGGSPDNPEKYITF